MTKGNGTETARYVKIDKTVFFSYRFVFGSTSSVTGALTVTLPSTAQGRAYQCTISLDDDGNNLFFAIPLLSTDKVEIRAANASGTYLSSTVTTSTIPFTWSTNDVINVAGTYEEA